jgi:hypothetical protein
MDEHGERGEEPGRGAQEVRLWIVGVEHLRFQRSQSTDESQESPLAIGGLESFHRHSDPLEVFRKRAFPFQAKNPLFQPLPRRGADEIEDDRLEASNFQVEHKVDDPHHRLRRLAQARSPAVTSPQHGAATLLSVTLVTEDTLFCAL